jgi:hypothetical protein
MVRPWAWEVCLVPLSNINRSYVVILKEDGVPHAVSFPHDVTVPFIVKNFEDEGYTVLDHKITETPDDEKHIATIVLTVDRTMPQDKSYVVCPKCGEPTHLGHTDLEHLLESGGDIEAVCFHCEYKWMLTVQEKARVRNQRKEVKQALRATL